MKGMMTEPNLTEGRAAMDRTRFTTRSWFEEYIYEHISQSTGETHTKQIDYVCILYYTVAGWGCASASLNLIILVNMKPHSKSHKGAT